MSAQRVSRGAYIVRLALASLLVAIVSFTLLAVSDEMRTSWWQASLIGELTRDTRYTLEPGRSPSVRFPQTGPYDERLGYHSLPDFVDRLQAQGYVVTAQARMSPRMVELAEWGLFLPYHEKNQAGLELRDCRDDTTFGVRYPERVYQRFEDVPPVLVETLLFIENRELLDAGRPNLNPAIDWGRLLMAVAHQTVRLVDETHPGPGASTLATQIEKYRHSPLGRTDSMREKLRQMASASVRAYLDGGANLPRRRQIVVDYLSTMPLSAQAGVGEVNGLGDGLWAWYGRDFAEVNRVLARIAEPPALLHPSPLQERSLTFRQALLVRQALAYKQALSLMIAQRRPSYYLAGGEASLAALTNSYLRILADAGVISPALRDAALPIKLKLQRPSPMDEPRSFIDRKAATLVRTKLSGMLAVPRAYDLDRLDLSVTSSLDTQIQRLATDVLRSLKEPAGAKAAGLYGHRLLNEGDDPGKLIFSFTLFERGEHANFLRVQTDNYDQPLDINEGSKLDLGSTAKLRTLITYLELVAELHGRWGELPGAELEKVEISPRDTLGRWAREHLLRASDKSLSAMLEAAMERRFSASTGETFFTGGGEHRFENFDPKDSGRVMTVGEGLRRSVNLVFIRLMRELVHHHMYRAGGEGVAALEDPDSPLRQQYLERFADREGRQFLQRFYRKYQGKSPERVLAELMSQVRPTKPKLASVFFALEPDAGIDDMASFLRERLPGEERSEKELRSLYDIYNPGRFSLADRGYVAGVHPLELWLVGHLRRHPGASLAEAVAASSQERQAVYAWLFKTRHKSAQDVRIRSLIERDAFEQIHRAWRRLGYPFDSLTPSYASSIGASGDRPAALAELMGIIVDRGMRLPVERVGAFAFARGTPYETRLAHRPAPPERVMPAEVADTVRRALIDVVENGTAQRLKGALVRSDGKVVVIGGKTGTGDHRYDVHGAGGRLISSRVVSRSASFVFLIGDRYFGTMMAYVQEPHAAKYRFTSALPTQLLKSLAPTLLPLVEHGACSAEPGPDI